MASAAFGFSLNEYYDHKKDISMPNDHLIPLGVISRKEVLVISVCWLLLSIALSAFLTPYQIIINATLVIILSLYSLINNKYGIFANLLVAACSCLGILASLKNFEWSITCYSGLTFFLHILGREIILDIHDYEADQKIGKNSFPILFSINKSFTIAMLLSISCIVYAALVGLYFMKYHYIVFIFLANAVFLAGLINYQLKAGESAYNKFVLLSRLSFLFSVPALF